MRSTKIIKKLFLIITLSLASFTAPSQDGDDKLDRIRSRVREIDGHIGRYDSVRYENINLNSDMIAENIP